MRPWRESVQAACQTRYLGSKEVGEVTALSLNRHMSPSGTPTFIVWRGPKC